MTSLPMPDNLVEAAARSDDPALRAWLNDLPSTVAELADRWDLQLGEPYQPGGQTAWVAPTIGNELVLKVGWLHDESEHEADGLRAWAGHGVVTLHEHHRERLTTALLLECCDPGTTLEATLPEPDRDAVVAGLLSQLWEAPTAGPFRPLTDMCDLWAAGFERDRAAGRDPGLDSALLADGLVTWRELPRTASTVALLPTDLHGGNILAAQREPWLVIDPKPYVGDPAYDVLQHMLNCDRLEQEPAKLCDRMADLAGLDRSRVRAWMFARAVIESIDQPHLRPVAVSLAR